MRHLFPLTIVAIAVLASSQTVTTISRSTNEGPLLRPLGLTFRRACTPDVRLENSIDTLTGRNGDENVEVIAQQSCTYVIRVKPIDASEPKLNTGQTNLFPGGYKS